MRSRREIERNLSERLIHRENEAKSRDAGSILQRLTDDLSEHNTYILNQVVFINVEISDRLDGQVEPGVRSEKGQHVVKKTDPC
jgi:hypothetical protein